MSTRYKISAVVIILVLSLLVIYFTRSYPVALVGGHFVSTRELETSILLAKRLEQNPDKENVYDQLITNVKKQLLVGKVDVDSELRFYKTRENEEYNKFVNDYFGGDEKIFIKYVVGPQVVDSFLRIKYNSDFAANNDAYNKVENILTRLNQGQTFEDLAKTHSDDKVSGQLGGDLGFVKPGQILPELERVVSNSPIGEVKKSIIVSRLGYHILYPIESATVNNEKVWHLKHVLIQTTGYENWLSNQLNQIRVVKLFAF